MEKFFIPYSMQTDFWDDVGDYRYPSREFWNWSEIMLGERAGIADKPSTAKPWAIAPHCQKMANKEIDSGEHYENGRLVTFLTPELAMMFKLRWF